MYSSQLPVIQESVSIAAASGSATELELLQQSPAPPTSQSSPLNSQPAVNQSSGISSNNSSPHCRYCLGRNQSVNYDGEDRESLIGPCSCRGSVGLVHPGCLARWLQVSRKHRCELCGFDLRQSAIMIQHHHQLLPATPATAETSSSTSPLTTTVPPTWADWLRQPEQICCLAMTTCCLAFVAPLIGVLGYFVHQLRRQVAASPGDEGQAVLFELLTGFAAVVLLIWLVYGSATCFVRYRAWRRTVRRQRQARSIVLMEEAAA